MKSLVSYLGCGRYVPRNNKDFGEFIVTKFEDVTEKIIPCQATALQRVPV